MILGGIPYYLDMLDKDENFPTNIDNIMFSHNDSQDQYAISNTEEEKLRRRMSSYRQETATRNGMIMTLITTYGLKDNAHSGVVDNVVTLDQLFL